MKSVIMSALWGATIAATLFSGYWLGTAQAFSQTPSDEKASKGLTFSGDVALWTVAIKPDKTADFEKVLAKVRDALQKSDKPERRQQAAGWRVMKMAKPLP